MNMGKISDVSVDKQLKFPKTVVPTIFGAEYVPQQQLRSNPSNRRKSTRYNALTFLPMTFMLQFTRVTNVFYIFNAILQSIPQVSTNNPFATIIPLSVIVTFGIIKEAVVELKKWSDDKHINATLFRKLTGIHNSVNRFENVSF